jgi:hypothetical protein
MSEHFAWQKSQQIQAEVPFISTMIEKNFFIPSREPPGRG